MENIQGMLEEIRGVVQNHFQDENQKISETMSVLDNLPIVIALRRRVAELTKINECLQESLRNYEEKENIELEIVELERNSSLEKKLITDFFTGSQIASGDEDEPEDELDNDLDASSFEESDNVAIIASYAEEHSSNISVVGGDDQVDEKGNANTSHDIDITHDASSTTIVDAKL